MESIFITSENKYHFIPVQQYRKFGCQCLDGASSSGKPPQEQDCKAFSGPATYNTHANFTFQHSKWQVFAV